MGAETDIILSKILTSGIPISISGQQILTSISGNKVLISGQPVLISGQSITAGVVVSSGNSTTALLGAGGTFTGIPEDLTGYSQITIQLFTDKPSATDGLQAQFSPDITFAHPHIHSNTIPANDSDSIHLAVDDKFFRVVYVNDATPQGIFVLQTLLKPIPSQATIKNADLTLKGTDDVLATRAILTGLNSVVPSSGYIDVKVNPSGTLQVGVGGYVDLSGQPIGISGQEVTITPLLQADIHNTTITPNTFILSNAITPSKLVSLFRVQAAMTFAGVLSVSTSQGGTSGVVTPSTFNQNLVLTSGSLFIFDHETHSGESVNYAYSTSSLVIQFHVQEMPGGVY